MMSSATGRPRALSSADLLQSEAASAAHAAAAKALSQDPIIKNPPRPRRRSIGDGGHSQAVKEASAAAAVDSKSQSPPPPTRKRRASVSGVPLSSSEPLRSLAAETPLPAAAPLSFEGASPPGSPAARPRRRSVSDIDNGGTPSATQWNQWAPSVAPEELERPQTTGTVDPTRRRRKSIEDATESTIQKALFCGISWKGEEMDALRCMQLSSVKHKVGNVTPLLFEIQVRSLFHTPGNGIASRGVVLALGDFGKTADSWLGLMQPAMHLHMQGFDIVSVSMPAFDLAKYMKFGPESILHIIDHMKLERPQVLAQGVGGAIFIEAFIKNAEAFGESHMLHNMDFPRGKGAIFEDDNFEKMLSYESSQVWLTHSGEAGVGPQFDEGTSHVYSQIKTLQKNLQKSRQQRKEKDRKPFDELLLTENIGDDHVFSNCLPVGSVELFSRPLLTSMQRFFTVQPEMFQDSLKRGLVVEKTFEAPKRPVTPPPKVQVMVDPATLDAAVESMKAHLAHKRDKFAPKHGGPHCSRPAVPLTASKVRSSSPSPSDASTCAPFSRQTSPESTPDNSPTDFTRQRPFTEQSMKRSQSTGGLSRRLSSAMAGLFSWSEGSKSCAKISPA